MNIRDMWFQLVIEAKKITKCTNVLATFRLHCEHMLMWLIFWQSDGLQYVPGTIIGLYAVYWYGIVAVFTFEKYLHCSQTNNSLPWWTVLICCFLWLLRTKDLFLFPQTNSVMSGWTMLICKVISDFNQNDFHTLRN